MGLEHRYDRPVLVQTRQPLRYEDFFSRTFHVSSLPMPELFTVAARRKDWKKIVRHVLLPPPLPSPDDPVSQGTELN